MTFDEYWKSEYPPLYDVGKAVARAAWEAASAEIVRKEHNELVQLRTFVDKLAAAECEHYTRGWDCEKSGLSATAVDLADRMCVPCQARAAHPQEQS